MKNIFMKKIMLSILVLILMFFNTGCSSVFSKKAPNCESQIVKELVIDNVKRKDWYYQDIDENSISKVYIKNPAATKYDKDIDKYFCKGQFVVESTDVGFKPKKNYDDNDYYNYVKIYGWFNHRLEVTEIKKNTKYICEIEYSSQLSEGKTYVESDNCSNDAAYIFGLGKQGIFSCEDEDCEPIKL